MPTATHFALRPIAIVLMLCLGLAACAEGGLLEDRSDQVQLERRIPNR